MPPGRETSLRGLVRGTRRVMTKRGRASEPLSRGTGVAPKGPTNRPRAGAAPLAVHSWTGAPVPAPSPALPGPRLSSRRAPPSAHTGPASHNGPRRVEEGGSAGGPPDPSKDVAGPRAHPDLALLAIPGKSGALQAKDGSCATGLSWCLQGPTRTPSSVPCGVKLRGLFLPFLPGNPYPQ